MIELFCLSISHKSAGVDIRKKFVFSEDIQKKFSESLISSGNVLECVTLCTCNRTEIYFCGNDKSVNDVRKFLSEYSGISESVLIQYIRIFRNDNALNHLFRVACGIESVVIGEDEILGQVRNAYRIAFENKTVSHKLNMIFHSAITCAKKVKTDTELSKISVSTATLASNEAFKFSEYVNVLVIGATGKIGSTVLKNLMSHKNVNITVTIRERNAGFIVSGVSGIKTINYSERYKYMSESDCVISATSSPHYTITAEGISDFAEDGKKRLFIDLAVPPDIDENIRNFNNIRLIGIDYFEKLAETNNNIKLNSVECSKQIISDEIENLKKRIAFHEFLPELERIKKNLSGTDFEKLLYEMKIKLDSHSFSNMLEFFKNYGKD